MLNEENEKEINHIIKEYSEQAEEISLPGEQPPIKIDKIPDSEVIKLPLYEELFKQNTEIFLLAGELDPYFYRALLNNYKPLIKKISFNIIGGPYIAIEDHLFLKYYDVFKDRLENWWFAKKKDKWWESHPLFREAYENNNIKINIIKQRRERHFCIGGTSKGVFVEFPHEELEKSGGQVFRNNPRLTEKYLEIWHAIKKLDCYEWDKKEPEGALFKPRYIIEKEKAIKEKIKIRFSELLKQEVSSV